MEIASKLKELRRKLLISQEELAQRLGVSFPTVNRLENGRCQPSLRTLRAIRDLCEKNGIKWDGEEKQE